MPARPERYEARLARAIALFERHLDAPPGAAPGAPRRARAAGLAELADAAGLSRFHFHRVFTAVVGETVHAFGTRVRLERAVRAALAQRHAGARVAWKQAAAAGGYRSAAVFSRAFRRHFGCAPSAFDLAGYWAGRADADDARRVSAHFLRPAPPAPDDFAVALVERPAARLVVSRAWGAYVHPDRMLAAYERLVAWAVRAGLPVEGGRLAGASRDDPDVTPLARCRYDFALAVDDPAAAAGPLPDGLARARRAAGWWAVHAVAGDLAAVDRAWSTLYKAWLPAAGLALRDAPCEEVYRRTPSALGWAHFDLECSVPVSPPFPLGTPA